ncbi:unnamed protein product [Caenorhabditis brenneri]
MNLKYILVLAFLCSLWILAIESRKVTQKPKKADPPPPPPPKKDKSWVRSKIDSAKEKYEAGKQKIKSKISSFGSKHDETKVKNAPAPNAQKTTTARKVDWNHQMKTTRSYGWNSNIQGQGGVQNSLKTTKQHYGWNSNIQGNGGIQNPPQAGWNSNANVNSAIGNSFQTTKKPLFDRIKEKAKNSEKYVGKAVGWAKKDLGIGVEGPKKPSKILKYGKKAVEYVFRKKSPKSPAIPVSGYTAGSLNSNGYSGNVGSGNLGYSGSNYGQTYPESYAPSSERSSDLHQKVEFLRNRLEKMQETIQGTWNTSEAGTKYKLFEEKKNWNDAQLHCEELGSNLAYLDSESKNNYAKFLIGSQNVTMVWFGLRTEVGSEQESQDQYSNFSNLDGCGVVDRNGTWSISTCTMELPYLCQAFRFDVLVEIP